MRKIKRLEEFSTGVTEDFRRAFTDMYGFFAKNCDGAQREYYSKMVEDAKPIKVVSVHDVLTEEEIERITRSVKPKPKMCYENSIKLISSGLRGYNIMYCEGYMSCNGLPIEHAFNKVNGVYVDITVELALKNDVTEKDYLLIGEWNGSDAIDLMSDNGVYGGCYQAEFFRNHKKEI